MDVSTNFNAETSDLFAIEQMYLKQGRHIIESIVKREMPCVVIKK